MKKSLIETYDFHVKNSDIEYSISQKEIVKELDVIKTFLEKKNDFFSFFLKKPLSAYIWGDVGRGKTFLADLLYENLKIKKKLRLHFNSFMVYIHDELKKLKDRKDPLKIIAKSIKNRTDILFFDEFFVNDIADAMLLGKLTSELFKLDIILVCTSNIHPNDLYKGGLQRVLFLPAIKEIKKNCNIFFMDISKDFRLRNLEKVNLFYPSLNEKSESLMNNVLLKLVKDKNLIEKDSDIVINKRSIKVKSKTKDIIWFDFTQLCDGPRSSSDYVEIAKNFHTIFLSDVPIFTEFDDDKARRFISLIDEIYDHKVNLIISCEDSINELYKGSDLSFPFKRTISRLVEMQSKEYLSISHIT